MDKIKVAIWAAISAFMGWLGSLPVPVVLLIGCNFLDYVTGLLAAPYRKEEVKSYKSIRGITKKVCQWLLVIVGAAVDWLIRYAMTFTTIQINVPFIVATAVAIWLVVNEIISILENMIDIGVTLPPFLMPIVKYIKKQVEDGSKMEEGFETDKQGEEGKES